MPRVAPTFAERLRVVPRTTIVKASAARAALTIVARGTCSLM